MGNLFIYLFFIFSLITGSDGKTDNLNINISCSNNYKCIVHVSGDIEGRYTATIKNKTLEITTSCDTTDSDIFKNTDLIIDDKNFIFWDMMVKNNINRIIIKIYADDGKVYRYDKKIIGDEAVVDKSISAGIE